MVDRVNDLREFLAIPGVRVFLANLCLPLLPCFRYYPSHRNLLGLPKISKHTHIYTDVLLTKNLRSYKHTKLLKRVKCFEWTNIKLHSSIYMYLFKTIAAVSPLFQAMRSLCNCVCCKFITYYANKSHICLGNLTFHKTIRT